MKKLLRLLLLSAAKPANLNLLFNQNLGQKAKFPLVLFFSLFGILAQAQVAVTPATLGANISADKAANATLPAFTTLGNIVMQEGPGVPNNGNIAKNVTQLVLNAPTGWTFQTSGVTATATGGDITVGTITYTTTAITIPLTVATITNRDLITIIGVSVRSTEGAATPNSGNITPTFTGTITGLATSSNLGSLSQVAGAATKLIVTLPGQTFTDGLTVASSGNSGTVTAQTAGTSFNITKLTATDQFFNIVTTFTGAKTISYSGPGSGLTAPSYTTAVTFASGQSTTVLATILTKAETTTITATHATVSGTASSSLVVNVGALDHFNFNTIVSQRAGTPFSVTIIAKDANDNTVTSFVSTAVMSTTAGTISPSTTNAFTAGLLTQSFTVTQAGTLKTITATASGKTGTSNAFTVNNVITTTAVTSDNSSGCENTSVTFTAAITGAAGVAITGTVEFFDGATSLGTSTVSGGQATLSSSSLTAGSHSITAVYSGDANNNASTSSAFTQNILASPLLRNVTGGGSYCSGGTGVAVGLDGSSSLVTYQLMNGASPVGSAVAGTGSALNFGNQTAAGTYTVVATLTSTGCTRVMSGSAIIIVNPLPVVRTVTGGGSYCSGTTGVDIGLNASSSGTTYQLILGGNTVATIGGTGGAISFGLQTAPGTYSATGTITSTGCTIGMTGSAIVTVKPSPHARLDKRYPVSQCGNGADGLIIIDTALAGGTQPFVISSNGITNTNPQNFVFNNLAQGTYRIIVTGANGCVGFDSSIIIGLANPMVVTATYISKPGSCGGSDGAFSAHVSGGIEPIMYSISINGGAPSPYQKGTRFTGLPAGVPIIITAKDFRNGGMLPGCTASSDPIVLTAASPITVGTNSVTGVSACNLSDGSINAKAGNGFAPYTYSLTGTVNRPFQSSNIFSGLPVGTYTVTAKDAKACTGTSSTITISKNTALTASIYTKTNVSCIGGSDGSITGRAIGGASPYMYSLSGGAIIRPFQASNLFSNLPANAGYTITVKDVRNCTATMTVPLADGTTACRLISSSTNSTQPLKPAYNSDVKNNKAGYEGNAIKINVLSNPSSTDFTVILQSRSDKPVQLRVFNMYGQAVHYNRGSATQQYRFGANFVSGMYLLQVTQGKATASVKLIKGN